MSDAEADTIFDAYLNFYENSWQLFADVEDCLNDLSDFHLGIISNGDAVQQRHKLNSLEIADKFKTIVISGEVGITKPDPDIFQLACQKAGVNPSDCWYIGDNLKVDVYGSLSAGMEGIWLNRNGQKVDPGIISVESLAHLNDTIDANRGEERPQ